MKNVQCPMVPRMTDTIAQPCLFMRATKFRRPQARGCSSPSSPSRSAANAGSEPAEADQAPMLVQANFGTGDILSAAGLNLIGFGAQPHGGIKATSSSTSAMRLARSASSSATLVPRPYKDSAHPSGITTWSRPVPMDAYLPASVRTPAA